MIVAAVSKQDRFLALVMASAIFVLVAVPIVSSQNPPQQQTEQTRAAQIARAKELMRLARVAAGIESASGEIKTLSFTAKSQRRAKYVSVQSPTKVVEKEKTLSGKFEADFSLPDKFRLKTKGSTLVGFGFSYTEIVNGEQAWRDPPMNVRSFGRDSRVIDVGDVERTLLMQTRTARQQIAFYTLGWVLSTPPAMQTEMIYAGEYELEGRPAEVVVIEGQDGFRVLLLFDKKTHLLSALAMGFFDSYRETVIVDSISFDRAFTRATFAKAREERRLRTQPPKQHEVQWLFSDYRQVNRVTLPHLATIKFDERIIEEITINEFKINHSINPKKFDGKPEVKY